MASPLAPDLVLQAMADALPDYERGDSASYISSSLDAIALFVHGCMTSLGFRVIGLDEDHNMEAECSRLAPRLPKQWISSVNSHGFLYVHGQSSRKFVIRVDRLGGKTEIRGLALGDEDIARFEVAARHYVSSAALPLRIHRDDADVEIRDRLWERLKEVFVSAERMKELATLCDIYLIQRLFPSNHKEKKAHRESAGGLQAVLSPSNDQRNGSRHRPPSPTLGFDPYLPPPRRLVPAVDFPPPGFEDEHEITRPVRMPGPSGPRFSIGHDDLYPAGLGPHDPLRGSFIPGRTGGGGAGGGMHPTFDDPLFGGPRGGDGDEIDLQVPTGARWDPVGPGGAPRFGGGRPGSGPFGGFGGDDII